MTDQTAQNDVAPGLIKADAETAFVLGNGPSLANVDLKRLNGFATFGMNAAYRYWRDIDWRPTHYVCLDTTVGLSHKDEIADLIAEGRIGQFLLRSNLIAALGTSAATRRVSNFEAMTSRHPNGLDFPITTGAGAALWAADLGYRRLVVLGVDGRYKELVDGAVHRGGIELEIVEEKANPNYFFDGYQREGDRYNIPNPRPDLHVGSWRAAAITLQERKVEVFNGALGSAVQVFPFIDIDDFLDQGTAASPALERLEPQYTVTSPTADPARSASERGARFFKSHRLALSGLAIGGVIFALLAFATLNFATAFLMTLLCAALCGLAAGFFYFRSVAVARLNELTADLSALEARILDAERLVDAED